MADKVKEPAQDLTSPEMLAAIALKVEENGYTFIGVEANEHNPNLIHTVGLTERGWPELMACGDLPLHVLGDFVCMMVELWENKNPEYGIYRDKVVLAEGGKTHFASVLVDHKEIRTSHLQLLEARYPHGYRICQVLWPDDEKSLPHEPGYKAEFGQPVLPMLDQELPAVILDKPEPTEQHNVEGLDEPLLMVKPVNAPDDFVSPAGIVDGQPLEGARSVTTPPYEKQEGTPVAEGYLSRKRDDHHFDPLLGLDDEDNKGA